MTIEAGSTKERFSKIYVFHLPEINMRVSNDQSHHKQSPRKRLLQKLKPGRAWNFTAIENQTRTEGLPVVHRS
jgi:hypothetical protein